MQVRWYDKRPVEIIARLWGESRMGNVEIDFNCGIRMLLQRQERLTAQGLKDLPPKGCRWWSMRATLFQWTHCWHSTCLINQNQLHYFSKSSTKIAAEEGSAKLVAKIGTLSFSAQSSGSSLSFFLGAVRWTTITLAFLCHLQCQFFLPRTQGEYNKAW